MAQSAVQRPVRWFVLLQPLEAPGAWRGLVRDLERLSGGIGDPVPHITVAHAEGPASPEDVAKALSAFHRTIEAAPAAAVRGEGEPLFFQGERMHFRWTVGQRVARSEGLRPWYEGVHGALQGLGLVREWDWARWRPYVTVLRGGEGRPAPDEASRDAMLEVLRERRWAVDFAAEQLWVSRLEGGQFSPVLSLTIGRETEGEG